MAVKRKGLGRGLDGLIPNYKSDTNKTEAKQANKPATKPAAKTAAKSSAKSAAKKSTKPAKQVKKDADKAKKATDIAEVKAAEELAENIDAVVNTAEEAAVDTNVEVTAVDSVVETSEETATETSADAETVETAEEATEESNVSRETLTEDIIGTSEEAAKETDTIVEAAQKLVDAFDLPDADTAASAAVIEAAPEAEKKMTENNGPIYLKISEVEPNKEQPRRRFNEDALAELSESIKQYGVISPLIVKERDGYYEIVAGERRWRAAKMAGLKTVPAIIRDLSEKEIMEISLIENIQREDLNPIEEAEAFAKLLNDFDMTQDELATRVSRSRTAITNAIRLLKLDKRVQEMLIEEMISSGHARALLGIADGDLQKEAADKIFDEHLSVRETEKLVKQLSGEKKQKTQADKQDTSLDYIYQDMEEKIKEILGTKVVINRKNEKKGKIEIEYYSAEELERIYDLLGQLRR